MDDDEAEASAEHRRSPNQPVSPSALASLGVLHWLLPPGDESTPSRLAAIRMAAGYSFDEEITVARGSLPDYDAKLKAFYEEHIHADEEIRYVLDGAGYFDVRHEGLPGRPWVRLATKPGDLIVLPAGCCHRFTLDAGERIRALRLFVGPPVWTPVNVEGGEAGRHPARAAYLAGLEAGKGAGKAAA